MGKETNYKEMLSIAKYIMINNEEYYLCGSLALILSGKIKERNVNDIDFIVNKDRFVRKKLKLDDSYGESIFNGYTCYKTSGDSDGFYYNVFVHDDSSRIKAKRINGIRCQDPNQILEYKKEWGRRKDVDDIKSLKGW